MAQAPIAIQVASPAIATYAQGGSGYATYSQEGKSVVAAAPAYKIQQSYISAPIATYSHGAALKTVNVAATPAVSHAYISAPVVSAIKSVPVKTVVQPTYISAAPVAAVASYSHGGLASYTQGAALKTVVSAAPAIATYSQGGQSGYSQSSGLKSIVAAVPAISTYSQGGISSYSQGAAVKTVVASAPITVQQPTYISAAPVATYAQGGSSYAQGGSAYAQGGSSYVTHGAINVATPIGYASASPAVQVVKSVAAAPVVHASLKPVHTKHVEYYVSYNFLPLINLLK